MSLNIIHLVSNKVWGGGERFVLDLAKRCTADGHSVAVITRGKEAVDSRFIEAGFTPGKLPLGGIFDFVSPSRLAHILDRLTEPVIIHVHNFKDARTALKAKHLCRHPENVRIVATRHLVKPGKRGKSAAELYNALDAIVFESKAGLEGFLSSSPEVDPSRLSVLPLGIVLEGEVPEHEYRDEHPVKLMYVGRISHEKGLDTLLNAIALTHSDIQLDIVGTGAPREKEKLERLAYSLGIRSKIVWRGHVKEPLKEMCKADIGIQASPCESFGLVVLEFMHCGTPVITGDNSGPAEILDNGVTGLTVRAGDVGAFAAAIDSLAENPSLRMSMGREARKVAGTRYSYESFYQGMLKIYNG